MCQIRPWPDAYQVGPMERDSAQRPSSHLTHGAERLGITLADALDTTELAKLSVMIENLWKDLVKLI